MDVKIDIVPGPKPNEKIIKRLREMLKDAKEGKIQGLGAAIACVCDDKDADAGRATETIIVMSDGWAHSTSAAVGGLFLRLFYERYTEGDTVPDTKLGEDDE